MVAAAAAAAVVVVALLLLIFILAVETANLPKLQPPTLACTFPFLISTGHVQKMHTQKRVVAGNYNTHTHHTVVVATVRCEMFICFSGGLLPRHSCRRCVCRMERGRYCALGGLETEQLQRRRQLDRVGGNGPHYRRGGWRRRRRHRHCLDVGR